MQTTELISLLPYVGGGFGSLILILSFIFRADIKIFLRGGASRKELINRVEEVENKTIKLESTMEAFKTTLSSQHTDIVRQLGSQNERIAELSESIKDLTMYLLNAKTKGNK